MECGKSRSFFDTGVGGFLYIILVWLLSFLFIVLGEALGSPVSMMLMTIASTAKSYGNTVWADALSTGALYSTFIGIWGVILVYLGISKRDRPIYKKVAHGGGNTILKLLGGLILGFALNMICAFTAMMHGDIALSFRRFDFFPVLVVFVLVFVQSSAEELALRGFCLRKIAKRFRSPWIPILGTALLFMLIHVTNDGVTPLGLLSIFLSGVFFGEIAVYCDSLWCAMAAHAGWNFTQSILLGLPNSGVVLPYSIFGLDSANARDSFAYSTSFGLEGTITANVLFFIMAILMWYFFGRNFRFADEEK